jgi:hypothetical protein
MYRHKEKTSKAIGLTQRRKDRQENRKEVIPRPPADANRFDFWI